MQLLKTTATRHFSHVTKSRIFKNFNLRRKVNRNFHNNLLKNHFRNIKLYSNPPSWVARSRHMGTLWKTKGWSSHFWKGQPFRFCQEITAKTDLNLQKQVFLLNLRLWSTKKPKIWFIFYGKKFIEEDSIE